MVMLHKRGMVSAMLFEGWAKDEKEAVEALIELISSNFSE